MPNKPDKFGIKFWLAVDVDTKYILNVIPYLGKKESRAPSQRLFDGVVMNLMQLYLGKGRNVTTDNFFTSYSLAKQLLLKTSIVGTANQLRKELLPSAKKQATRHSTVFLKTDDVATLTIYQCKPTKNVCVLSSLHMSVGVDSSEKRKPEPIELYKKNKCGVDVADQMAHQYTRRWPVAVFYNILNLACINAFVLYKKTGDSISRRDFIVTLAWELKEDYITEKSSRKIAPAQALSTAGKKSLKRKQCQVAVNCKQNKSKSREVAEILEKLENESGRKLAAEQKVAELTDLLKLENENKNKAVDDLTKLAEDAIEKFEKEIQKRTNAENELKSVLLERVETKDAMETQIEAMAGRINALVCW